MPRGAHFRFCLNDLKIAHREASEVRSKGLLFSLQREWREDASMLSNCTISTKHSSHIESTEEQEGR